MNSSDSSAHLPAPGKGGNPFETIRRVDDYGREYWSARELMPLLGYSKWSNFERVIDQAITAATLLGVDIARNFAATGKVSGSRGPVGADYELSRYACYVTAMRGDSHKKEIAEALTYFAVMTREAELGLLSVESVQRTALARAREMVDYRTFRDMMAENAPDYVPSSRATGLFFATVQNKLYVCIVGMTAHEIKHARPLNMWPGRADGKPEPSAKSAVRKVAKNYLTEPELGKLNRMVGRLCLRAEDIAEDNLHLTLPQWEGLVDVELATTTRRLAA